MEETTIPRARAFTPMLCCGERAARDIEGDNL
jgi:hypothetical protein